MAVSKPAKAISDLTEPRSSCLPVDLLDVLDRVEGEVQFDGALFCHFRRLAAYKTVVVHCLTEYATTSRFSRQLRLPVAIEYSVDWRCAYLCIKDLVVAVRRYLAFQSLDFVG